MRGGRASVEYFSNFLGTVTSSIIAVEMKQQVADKRDRTRSSREAVESGYIEGV